MNHSPMVSFLIFSILMVIYGGAKLITYWIVGGKNDWSEKKIETKKERN